MNGRSLLSVPSLLAVVAILWPLSQSPGPRAQSSPSPRERIAFNADWRFQKGDPAEATGVLAWEKVKGRVGETGAAFRRTATGAKTAGETPAPQAGTPAPQADPGDGVAYTRTDLDDSAWRKVDLPHDWGIEGPFRQELPGGTGKLPWPGVGWYRKHFRLDEADKARRIFLDVDGAMSYAMVWVNGRFVGGWPYGYSSFRVELTSAARVGADNVIAVRLDNPPSSSRWYPGSGLYRNVWLVKTTPVHVAQWGTRVATPEVAPHSAKVEVEVTVENQSGAAAEVTARTDVYAFGQNTQTGPRVAALPELTLRPRAGAVATATSAVSISNPRLWNLATPNLYVAVTTLTQEGRTVDRYETTFGIRTIRFDAQRGFLLNGTRVPLNGVCMHHDLGALGTAINLSALRRQVALLKEMGVNAIRTSHNPPAPELLDLCDRMGIVVMDEAFDCWKRGKTPNDYHLLWDEWHEKDIRALVRRDRNHPSVVLWSIGNEVPDQRAPEGLVIAAELTRTVHEEDPTRPTGGGFNDVQSGYNGIQKTVDVFGYNYKPVEYTKFRQANPAIPLIGAETASTVSSRGEYVFPVSDDKKDGRADNQVSSYDLYAPPWAWPPDVEWKGLDENAFVGGEFVWTGFDYLGEPTPFGEGTSPSRSSYFGILDLAGLKKDRFYIYQSRWRPELPMAHILPHWNWPDRVGQVTPVHVYSSGDEVELFLNGKSLGRRQRAALQYRFRWDDVTYEPGELRAVAYKAGKKWAEDVVRTTGPAAKVVLQPDRTSVAADGKDLAFVVVTIADSAGRQVPRASHLVHVDVSGGGELVAVDNGDATSHAPFQSREVKAFNGQCLAIVRLTKGPATLTARVDGLSPARVTIPAR
jgi:beta-galactosidase